VRESHSAAPYTGGPFYSRILSNVFDRQALEATFQKSCHLHLVLDDQYCIRPRKDGARDMRPRCEGRRSSAPASDSSRFLATGPLRPQKYAEVGHCFVEASGVTPDSQQLERTGLAIETRLGATDQLIPDE
jgi:hypothetical protein